MAVKKSLGRGLGALLGTEDDDILPEGAGTQTEIAIEKIERNESQPRKRFDDAAMTELVNSIRIHGIITPIIVVSRGNKYMIIAGERRWRAARMAGLRTVPAIVREYSEKQVKEISLIENLQREDLNPIEVAEAVRQLMQEYSYTQEEVADRIGKSRSAVANTLGLLTLDPRVISLVSSGTLSAGHAKVLTAIQEPDVQFELALKGADDKMSVRRFEEYVKLRRFGKESPIKPENLSIELRALVEHMQRVFATKVSAVGNDNKGRIYIDYFTRDDLDRIQELVASFAK